MLTVKHDHSNSETVFECTSVVKQHKNPVPTVICYNGTEQHELMGGRVYVMNEAGKTVSVHNLELKTGEVLGIEREDSGPLGSFAGNKSSKLTKNTEVDAVTGHVTIKDENGVSITSFQPAEDQAKKTADTYVLKDDNDKVIAMVQNPIGVPDGWEKEVNS